MAVPFLCLWGGSGAAQVPAEPWNWLEPGMRVRVSAPEVHGRKIVGRIVRITADTMYVRLGLRIAA